MANGYPEIYADNIDIMGNGIPLIDAFNVVVRKKINTAQTLSFNINRDSKLWRYIRNDTVVKVDGQFYIIKIISDGSDNGKLYAKVEAVHIWWEICEKKHIPHYDIYGKIPNVIMGDVFSNIYYLNYPVRLMPDEEIYALGLMPVFDATDIINMSKTNPLQILSKIISNVHGEIYVDNFNFALVRGLVRESGQVFTLGSNVKGIDRTEDNTKLVTRLYPYGKDGLEISSVNNGNAYIDSPFLNAHPYPFGGTMDFTDFETPEGLLRRAQWEFSPDNYNRVDKPKLSYKCSVIDLWKLAEYPHLKRLDIGDYVTVHDKDLSIDTRMRVTECEYYPYEPLSSRLTLGDPPKTIGNILAGISKIKEYYYQPPVPMPDISVITDAVTVNPKLPRIYLPQSLQI